MTTIRIYTQLQLVPSSSLSLLLFHTITPAPFIGGVISGLFQDDQQRVMLSLPQLMLMLDPTKWGTFQQQSAVAIGKTKILSLFLSGRSYLAAYYRSIRREFKVRERKKGERRRSRSSHLGLIKLY
jgi:hypothetical protein